MKFGIQEEIYCKANARLGINKFLKTGDSQVLEAKPERSPPQTRRAKQQETDWELLKRSLHLVQKQRKPSGLSGLNTAK